MKIVVDPDLCQGHGVCESEAPGVFSVPKGGPVDVLVPEPPEELRPQVDMAVRYCPTSALRVLDD